MVEAVLGLDRMRVRELMTPRNDIVWLNADLPAERLVEHLLASGHSRLPLFQGRRDNLLGVVSLRDVFAALRSGQSPDLRALARPPLLVPPTQPVLRLLETFRASGETFAVVADDDILVGQFAIRSFGGALRRDVVDVGVAVHMRHAPR